MNKTTQPIFENHVEAEIIAHNIVLSGVVKALAATNKIQLEFLTSYTDASVKAFIKNDGHHSAEFIELINDTVSQIVSHPSQQPPPPAAHQSSEPE